MLGTAGLFSLFAVKSLKLGADPSLRPLFNQVGLFPWAVFFLALWRSSRIERNIAAAPIDGLALFLVASACVLLAAEVSTGGIGLGVGFLGLYLLLRSGNNSELRAAAICLLALFTNLSVAPLLFHVGYGKIIGVDMALLQFAINFIGAPITATPAGFVAEDGLRVMLVGACSSFTGISAAVLVHMGWAMLFRTEVSWRDVIAVVLTVIVATLLNITRLTLTASGHDAYAIWHGPTGQNPYGAQLFWFLQNAILLTGGYLSATWASGVRPLRVAT